MISFGIKHLKKLNTDRTRVFLFAVFGVFIALWYLSQFSGLSGFITHSISLMPFIVVFLFLVAYYLDYHQDARAALILEKTYLFSLLKILSANLLLFIVFFYDAWKPIGRFWLDILLLSKNLFAMENFFLFAAYLFAAAACVVILLFSIRLYQKTKGTHHKSFGQLLREHIYVIIFLSLSLFAFSILTYPQAYAPVAGALSDVIYSALGARNFSSADIKSSTEFSSLRSAISQTMSNFNSELSKSNNNLTDLIFKIKNDFSSSINETAGNLQDDINKKVSKKGGSISGSLTLSGSDGDLIVEGTTTTKDIIPRNNLDYNLGDSDKSWNIIYAHRLIGASPIFIGSNSSELGLTGDGDLVVSNDAEIQGVLYAENITVNGAYSLPTIDGSAGQLLQTDGNGVLSWDDSNYLINPMTALGDIIYGGTSGDPARLAGSAGFLTSTGAAVPAWTSASADYFTQYALLDGRSGGQTLIGGIGSGDDLILQSTSNATKGSILFGTSAYDEANNRLGIGTTSPSSSLSVVGSVDIKGPLPWIDVRAYGATGNGTTDDTAAIQAALDAVPTLGGTVLIPSGTYSVTALTITKPTIVWGSGWSTRIKVTSATADTITSSSTSQIYNIRFYNSGTRTAGSYVHFTGNNSILDNFFMTGQYIGVRITSGATVRVRNGSIRNGATTSGSAGILVDGGNDHYIENITMDAPADAQPAAGIQITNSGMTNITNVDIIHQGNNLLINPSSGEGVFSTSIIQSFFDTAVRGIYISPSGSGNVLRTRFTEVWTSSNTSEGTLVENNGSGVVDGIDIVNHHSFYNGLDGLRVKSGVTNVRVNSGGFSTNTGDGIEFDAGVSQFSVIGARVGAQPGGSGNGGWGILVNTGASDNYIIALNDLRGNTSGGLSDSGTGVNKQVSQNIPWTGDTKATFGSTIESTTGGFKFPDGTTQTTAASGSGGGSQTPWTSNINAAGYTLSNVNQLGIGISSPTSPLHVYSSSLISGILSNIDENAAFSSADVTISGNLLSVTRAIDNNDNEFGDVDVDVTGAVAVISDALTDSGGYGNISSSADVLRLQQNYTGNAGAVLNIAGGGADAAFALRVNDDGTFTDSTPLVVDNTGQMGVGITAPAATLHVVNNEGAGATNQGLLLHLDNTAFAGISSTASNNGGGLVITADAASGTGFDFFAAISSAGGTDDAEFRLRGDGNAYADGAWNASGADYAEYFYTKNVDLQAGELVCVDVANSKSVKRCERANDLDLIGIISTKPAFVGNNIPGAEADLGEINKNYKLVGLIGQVPAKVSNENGKIQAGDSLTSASKPGYAMKASAGDSTVGVALENSDKEDGVITVLISRRNKSLTVEQVEEETTRRIAEMNIEDEVNALISDKINIYDQQLSDISLNISSSQSEADLLEEKAVKLEQDINNQADLIKEIQAQMADIKEQNKAIMDFFLAINPDTLLYKNSDGNLDLLSGKLIAQEVETGGITITVADEDAPTIGKAKIEIGESSAVTVKTKAVKENSKIFVTAKTLTEQPLAVTEIKDGESFKVETALPVEEDLEFDWWIVQIRS